MINHIKEIGRLGDLNHELRQDLDRAKRENRYIASRLREQEDRIKRIAELEGQLEEKTEDNRIKADLLDVKREEIIKLREQLDAAIAGQNNALDIRSALKLPVPEEPKPAKPNTCNMHVDCAVADKQHGAMWSGRRAEHCHVEDCEDCFGK